MLKEKLMSDLKEAMKEQQVVRKNVVQMIRAGVLQVEKDKQIELDDNQILEVIAKQFKERKDSLEVYEKSGRQDLIDQLHEEIRILTEYLPKQLNRDEIKDIVEEVIKKTGATSMKDMGKVMKLAKEKIGVSADGKTINEIAKELLS